MWNYFLRRVLYTVPILIGVNVLTFVLFFIVNTPDDMARMHLGNKHLTPLVIEHWKIEHGYNLPLFYNNAETMNPPEKMTQTIFFQKSMKMFLFEFGQGDNGRDILQDISQRMMPSLAIALPTFILSIFVNIVLALWLLFFRLTWIDKAGVMFCIFLMSISGLFYIIAGQYFVSKLWQLVPISGYEYGLDALKFVLLPVLIGVIANLGGGIRWYRLLFLEELGKEYVRTARAKGLSEFHVLFKHVLPNAMIPILTGTISVLPLLFMGSLIMEAFFAIPGLGSYTLDAIQAQDFATLRAMVFIGSVLYIIGLILTDFSYMLVDPRVKLGSKQIQS